MLNEILKALLIIAFVTAGAQPIFANPVAIDGSRRPIKMIAEKVMISVGPDVSQVNGTYKFKQESDDFPEEKDTHALIYVPVFVSSNAHQDPRDPIVKVNGVQIKHRNWNDLRLGDDPSDLRSTAAKGFRVEAYQYAVPLTLIQKTFTVTVSYPQNSFPGFISPYLPIKPPTESGSAQITFIAQKGYALKPFASRNFWSPSYSSLSFVPRDEELIRVKCVKKK